MNIAPGVVFTIVSFTLDSCIKASLTLLVVLENVYMIATMFEQELCIITEERRQEKQD